MDKDELQERSLRFAVAITSFTQVMRDAPAHRGSADQLSRCATSVGANYRAACRARSRAEFVSKLGLVVEEIDEAVYWLELITRGGLTVPATLEGLLDEAQQLRAIFAASYGTARRNYLLAQKHRRAKSQDR
ncbi:MAG: four helix bundle protein [Acidobacteriota bacterium]|nr:four helix bundle protein [Acidobacteriota bacterium]